MMRTSVAALATPPKLTEMMRTSVAALATPPKLTHYGGSVLRDFRQIRPAGRPSSSRLDGPTIDLHAADTSRQRVPHAARRANIQNILVALGVTFAFLANQREILETAFEDLALIGDLLLRAWPLTLSMAALLLVVLLSNPRER